MPLFLLCAEGVSSKLGEALGKHVTPFLKPVFKAFEKPVSTRVNVSGTKKRSTPQGCCDLLFRSTRPRSTGSQCSKRSKHLHFCATPLQLEEAFNSAKDVFSAKVSEAAGQLPSDLAQCNRQLDAIPRTGSSSRQAFLQITHNENGLKFRSTVFFFRLLVCIVFP